MKFWLTLLKCTSWVFGIYVLGTSRLSAWPVLQWPKIIIIIIIITCFKSKQKTPTNQVLYLMCSWKGNVNDSDKWENSDQNGSLDSFFEPSSLFCFQQTESSSQWGAPSMDGPRAADLPPYGHGQQSRVRCICGRLDEYQCPCNYGKGTRSKESHSHHKGTKEICKTCKQLFTIIL